MNAAGNNYPEVATLLLRRGADVNAQIEGGTALYAAAGNGDEDVARVLLDSGARIDAPLEKKGWTPLMESIARNRVGTARYLIGRGASTNPASFPAGPLVLATIHGQTELVSLLVEKGADVKARMPAHGRTETAKLLATRGARLDLTWTPRQLTALILAAHEGNVDLVELLIARGAGLNARTASGDEVIPAIAGTTYYFAGRAYGRDDYGYVTSVDPALTALGTAREQGYQDVASALVRAGAKE